MKNIYFGHPICFYNTSIEEYLLRAIHRRFPDDHIENPGAEPHQAKCKEYRWKGLNVMSYFTDEVLPAMDAGVFMAFPEPKGMIEKLGAGVWLEARVLRDAGKPIYEVHLTGAIDELVLDEARQMTVDETKARLKIEFAKNKLEYTSGVPNSK